MAALLSVAATLGLTLVAWSIGDRALSVGWRRGLPEELEAPARRFALSTTVGLSLLATALFFLGLPGLLDAWLLRLLFAVLVLDGWRHLRQLSGQREDRPTVSAGSLLPLAVMTGVVGVLALYPETGFDATLYHLPFAQGFLESGGLQTFPTLRFPVFPQAWELLFCWAMSLGGENAAALMQTVAMVLTALLLWCWGIAAGSRRVGLLAGSLWLGTPLIVVLSSSSYVDVGLALFVTATFYSWWQWRESRDSVWLGLAALFAGSAAATKYLGLYFIAGLLVLTVLACGRATRWRRAVLVAGIAAIVALPWYSRIFATTGNPVFPFFAGLFGDSAWASAQHYGASALPVTGAWQLGERILSDLLFLIETPWAASFDRQVFNNQAPASPFYLLVVPLSLLGCWRSRAVRGLVAMCLVYAILWLATIRDLRFLVPLFPLLSLAGFLELEGRGWMSWSARASRLAAAALLTPGLGYGLWKLTELGPIPLHEESRRQFIEERVPAARSVHWLNDEFGGQYTVYSFGFERIRYFAQGRFLGDHFGPWSYRTMAQRLNREGLEVFADIGACFVLVPKRLPISSRFADLPKVLDTVHYTMWQIPEVTCQESDGRWGSRSVSSFGTGTTPDGGVVRKE